MSDCRANIIHLTLLLSNKIFYSNTFVFLLSFVQMTQVTAASEKLETLTMF